MDPQDLADCREIHAGLMAKERNNINYLFLEPVDTTYFPDYLTVIRKPMDLRTLKENLDGGTYTTKEEFYTDTQLIFDNAIKFNKEREESKFIVDLSKRMIRAFERLMKKTEAAAAKQNGGDTTAAAAGGGTKKIKLKLKRNSSVLSVLSSNDEASGGGGDDGPPPNKKSKKVKLKFNLGGKATASTTNNQYGSPSISPVVETVGEAPMNASRLAQCYKIMSSFKRRQPMNCKYFLKPVSDPMLVKDYRDKITDPVDLGTISSK
jgi:hypothetical protein